MLFPLGIWHEKEGILDDIGRSVHFGNPVLVQVDNFPVSDGEVDQPVYEGPQTWSRSKKLMKTNILMDWMFEIDQLPIPEVVDNPESLGDLILKSWYQQVFTVYKVCCDLAEARTHSISC